MNTESIYQFLFQNTGKRKNQAIFEADFYELSRQKNCQILEGHLTPDHVYMCISIPPKHLVAQVIGYIKGKSAIAVARQFSGKNRNFNDESL